MSKTIGAKVGGFLGSVTGAVVRGTGVGLAGSKKTIQSVIAETKKNLKDAKEAAQVAYKGAIDAKPSIVDKAKDAASEAAAKLAAMAEGNPK